MAQPQRQRVGGAARLGDQPRLERRPRQHDARRLAGRRRDFGGEHHLDLGIARDRPRRAGQHAAELVEGLAAGWA